MKLRRMLGEYKFKYLMHREVAHTFRLQKNHDIQSFILMEAHRLEKSMCQAKQEPKRGYSRAQALLTYIERIYTSEERDGCLFALETGISVIHAFAEYKAKVDAGSDELLALNTALENAKVMALDNSKWGGVMVAEKPEASFEAAEKLFKSRHSCRSFSDISIDMEKLKQAISLAQYAPSACNRQPHRVYLVSDETLAKAKGRNGVNDYAAPYHLIVTVDCTAYTFYDFNDWIVSASMYTGYLTLALHSVGIGSCIMRKPLYENDEYIQLLRNVCKIPEKEKIVIELYIGNYPNSFIAPISRRLSVAEVLKIV